MTSRRVWLGLGSNLGDRQAHLQHVVDEMGRSGSFTDIAVSRVWSTEPVGGPAQPDFLNAVVQACTSMSAQQLLQFAQRCEAQRGRLRAERWGPRTLDVDIIAVEGEAHDSPSLTVPHPRARERAFVLLPLSDLVDPESVLGPPLAPEFVEVSVSDAHLHVATPDSVARPPAEPHQPGLLGARRVEGDAP